MQALLCIASIIEHHIESRISIFHKPEINRIFGMIPLL